MSTVSYYSAKGLKKLKKELNYLKDIERPRASQAIAEARDKGDLSENAEYDAANEAQGLLAIKNTSNDVVMNYKLVAESEADLKTGKISVSSPIGKGLLGKKVGEFAQVTVPNGEIRFEILGIER